MEEKERFELFGEHCIKDNNPDARCQLLDAYVACVILNEQDKEIKKLEEYNNKYPYHYSEEYMKNNRKLEEENQQLKQQLEELKGKRLEFYNDDVRQTQVINGVHFDIEQLLVFSEYVEHEKNISADKDKQINQLKQQLHDLPKKIVGEIEKCFTEYLPLKDKTGAGFYCRINAILKKFGEEDE